MRRIICLVRGHELEREYHEMPQGGTGVVAACYFDKCERCGLELHENSLYCDRVKWDSSADVVPHRP